MSQEDITSPSYMEMGLHTSGQGPVFLRIPTFWDDSEKVWIGAIRTPESKVLIHATGKDSLELQNNFNKVFKHYMQTELRQELFSLFKPRD